MAKANPEAKAVATRARCLLLALALLAASPRFAPAEPSNGGKALGKGWWSLQPVVRPTIPVVKAAQRIRNPIDAFILSELEARGLTLSAESDRATLIRRLSCDLHGLPPTKPSSLFVELSPLLQPIRQGIDLATRPRTTRLRGG
jgi:hypothetical protein